MSDLSVHLDPKVHVWSRFSQKILVPNFTVPVFPLAYMLVLSYSASSGVLYLRSLYFASWGVTRVSLDAVLLSQSPTQLMQSKHTCTLKFKFSKLLQKENNTKKNKYNGRFNILMAEIAQSIAHL